MHGLLGGTEEIAMVNWDKHIRFTPTEESLSDQTGTWRQGEDSRIQVTPCHLLVAAGILLVLAMAAIVSTIVVARWAQLYGSGNVVIHFVLPNGYRGPFRMAADGVDANGYAFQAGNHVYRVPPSGTLHIKTMWPIETWHRETAEYENGERIYWVDPSPPSNDAVRISDLGGYVWVVGSDSQVRYWKELWESAGVVGGATA